MKTLTNNWQKGQVAKAATLAIVFAISSVSAAQATAPKGDVFARSTKKTAQASHQAKPQIRFSTPTQWFEAVDDAVVKLRPTAADDAILNRPFNQDPERVEKWCDTAAKVAGNYRRLARTIRTLPLPSGVGSDVKEYRTLTSDWYDDAALVFEDMIRPRPPANSMEELESQLNDIKQRGQALARSNTDLGKLDKSLRKTYKVHRAHYDDALTQYVSRK